MGLTSFFFSFLAFFEVKYDICLLSPFFCLRKSSTHLKEEKGIGIVPESVRIRGSSLNQALLKSQMISYI